MKRVFVLLLFLYCISPANGQYTEIINSKRPGFSESPYGIGTNVFQFEAGLFHRTSNNTAQFARPKTLGGELFFRYGKFLEKLEINARIAYQKDEIKSLNDYEVHIDPLYEFGNLPGFNIENISGISALTIGAKYLIYQQEYVDKSKEIRSWKRKMAFDKKRLIPSVGIYAGVNTNFLGKDYKEEGISYKGALLLQNDISDRFVVLTNLIADKITSENSFYSHIITATYAINFKWSFFVENQGIYRKSRGPDFHFGTGIAYLYSPDLQIDASVRTNFFEDYSFVYSAVGFAWRLDRHSDQIIDKSSPKAPLLNKKRKRRRRGSFFSRLFKKN